ncbi:hypothetical protein [Spiroplasma endosymbiont of Labia minor]|uniref:hypothetical protein n=1 Tax=Spiroplasma endosymbiont of Labia minor TaxID=3066305 RepID=UPI0030CAA472
MDHVYLLKYTVILKVDANDVELNQISNIVMKKNKIFSTKEKANEWQEQYNYHFKDRKIIDYEIQYMKVDIDSSTREDIDIFKTS